MSNFTQIYLENINQSKTSGWIPTDLVETYKFEELDTFYWYEFAGRYRELAFYTEAVYIFAIFALQRWMKDRSAYELRIPLFLWNLSLGLFSIVGLVRSTPGLFLTIKSQGFYGLICTKEVVDIPTLVWTLAFVYSKYAELGDTIFIVLRKRPLIFLQYYHHLITLTACWLVAPHMEPVARIYAYLNYGVHLFMYNYFALRAIGIKVPAWIANIITTLQLAQMFIGMGVNLASMYYFQNGYDCFRHPESIKIFSLVYGSFIILFGNLFYEAVFNRKRKENLKKVE